MKKIIFFMLIIIMIYANVALASVGVKDEVLNYIGIQIEIDNNKIVPKDVNGNIVDPFIIEGTTYLPVRAISESLGKTVKWDGETRSVFISDSSGDFVIENFSGEVEKKVFQETKTLNYNDISILINEVKIEPKDANGNEVEPFIIDGTTYLPVRAVAEAFDKKVDWISEENKVLISSKEEKEIAKIDNVVVKIIDNIICAEISSKESVDNYNYYSMTEGKIKAEPYLNMRSNFNSSADIIATIPNETVISIKDVIKEQGKATWYKVSYDSKVGYVSADYVVTEPTRLILDLENTKFAFDPSAKEINYDIVKQIRFGAQENDVSRIVLDLNEISNYTVIQNDDKTITYLALDTNFKLPTDNLKDIVLVASNSDKVYLPKDEEIKENEESDVKVEENQDDKNSNIENGENQDNEIPKTEINENENVDINQDENVSDDDNEIIIENLSSVDKIKYSSSTNKTKITIDGNYEYTSFTLTNPDRIVVDISGAKLNVDGPKEINPNNKNITAIRFSQNDEDVVRVVFDVNAKSEYEIDEEDSNLVIKVEEPTYKNVDYIKYDNYSTLVLRDTDIDYFETSKSSSGNKYYISYSSRKFKSGTGTIETEDEYVNEIIIKSNKITIYGSKNVSYSIKQKDDDVIVTIKEKSEDNKIILIDAGHGGSDPGACNGTAYEKVYNLKIALKLYEMLKETDGIEVRMSRTEDVYLNRDDRLEFIIDNREADLLVSIHNNSLANKNYHGTMVLFYNKPGELEKYGITSKEFATIVQNNLVSELGTVDRGVINRDDLWVLTQNNLGERDDLRIANIPSILCEVAYISNDNEVARIKTDEFQQSAAQAIYDGIIEAISIMDN